LVCGRGNDFVFASARDNDNGGGGSSVDNGAVGAVGKITAFAMSTYMLVAIDFNVLTHEAVITVAFIRIY
jgi:hypothetical protein